MFCSVFDCTGSNKFNGLTLLDALWQGGGGHKALGRHTVAALLNAAGDVNYEFDVNDVISMFNAVWPCSGNVCNELKGIFAEQNEGVDQHCCPLGNCRCSNNHDQQCEDDGECGDPDDTCGGRNQGDSDCCEEDTTRSGCDDTQCENQV